MQFWHDEIVTPTLSHRENQVRASEKRQRDRPKGLFVNFRESSCRLMFPLYRPQSVGCNMMGTLGIGALQYYVNIQLDVFIA